MSCDFVHYKIKDVKHAESLLNNSCTDFDTFIADSCSTFKGILSSPRLRRRPGNCNGFNDGQNVENARSSRSSLYTELKLKKLQERLKKSVNSSSLRTRKNLLGLNNLCSQQQLQLLPCIALKSKLLSIHAEEPNSMYLEKCDNLSTLDVTSKEEITDDKSVLMDGSSWQINKEPGRFSSNQLNFTYEGTADVDVYDEFKKLPDKCLCIH